MTPASQKKFQEDGRTADELGTSFSERRFRESIVELSSRADTIKTALGERGMACAADPKCREAELVVELYKAEHDNAGAFKFKRFVRETVNLFDSGKIRSDEESGKYVLAPELEGKRYLFVSMSELDRLNKEGHSQEAGDAGLRAVIKAIDEVCLKYLGQERAAAKDIFRYGGNEYCVAFENIKPEELVVIEGAIKNGKLDLGEAWRSIEAPPLSVAKVDLADAVEVLNDTAADPDPASAGHKVVSIIRREADFRLETSKFITRVERAIERVSTAKTRSEAKDFFESYLKKGFHGSGLETIDDIEALVKGKDHEALRRTIEWMADDAAKKKFAEERKLDAFEDHLVGVRHHEILRTEPMNADAEHMVHDFDVVNKTAVIPPLTLGQAVLVRKKLETLGAKNTPWAGVKRLEYLIEVARRDEGTGLLERGQFYEDWNTQVSEAGGTGNDAAIVFVDMGFLKYFNDAGGRPVGDAALRKAAELMEEAVRSSGVKGKVYRYGGDEFAIRVEGGRSDAEKVTSALEELRAEAGRIPDLKGLQEQKGTLDKIGGSRADYSPTELVFNTGIAEIADFDTIFNDLRESGEMKKVLAARGLGESELKGVLMVKLADTSVNYEKAVSRFKLLIKLINDPKYQDAGSAYRARVESIINYSQKAILGGMGGDAALRFFADGQTHEEAGVLNEQIERFVADRLERSEKIKASEKELVDKLVEIHAVRNRLINQVEGLKAELANKTGDLEHEHRRVVELQARLYEAEKARQDLIEARQNVSAATLDKKVKMG